MKMHCLLMSNLSGVDDFYSVNSQLFQIFVKKPDGINCYCLCKLRAESSVKPNTKLS